MKRLIVPLVVFLMSASGLAAQGQLQQSAPNQGALPVIRSKADEVVLDMVFRDKKGRTIHDIRPEEIHILEDGIEQKLISFRLAEGNTEVVSKPSTVVSGAPSIVSGAPSIDPMREVRLVTLVFENLDQEGKRFFRKAVKGILDMTPEQNLFFSVLVIDHKLHCIQPFTADHNALLQSLDRSAMWSFVQYANQSAEVKGELKQILSEGAPQLQASGGPGGSGPSASQIQGAVGFRMAKMQYDMLEAADSADRRYAARETMEALTALVRAQAELPGRKAVLYFNPWLVISEAVKEQYQNLISAANRANVTFYTVDPKGLVTWSQNSMGRDLLGGATGEVRSQQMSGGVGEVSTQQARANETAEDAQRANPLLWLRDLAQQTGGSTVAETNDWEAPLRIVMDEVRTYYEASYSPHIAVYDGKFRKISVRVDRPGVVVNTRSGYFAMPTVEGGQPLLAYELPLLNALNGTSAPVDIAFQAAAERFNDHGAKIEYMLTMEAPLKEMTFAPQPDHKTSAVDAALLAVLKGPSGTIVERFSKDFAVQVALEKEDAYKAGNLVQTFRTELSPGTYTLEAAVMDRNSNKIGVKKISLIVPEPSGKLSMSNVVVVRRTDALKDTAMLDAFYFPGGKVVPTLTSTLKGGPGNFLPFYFSVYPDPAIKEAPKLTMSFYKDGNYLGAAEAPLPEAQHDGRIPYIASLPADKFTPGAYQIRMGVKQGSSTVEEKVVFQVE